MSEDGTDILMMVVQGGRPLTTGVTLGGLSGAGAGLLQNFESGKCCLLTGFTLGAGGEARSEPREGENPHDVGAKPAAKPKVVPPGTPHEVTFKRRMDGFSPLLLTTLVAGRRLDSVSMVKRKGAGGEMSGAAYLRLDFTGVLLVSLDWDDDEEGVEEKGSFVFLDLSVSYRPQNANGRLGVAVNGAWSGGSSGRGRS